MDTRNSQTTSSSDSVAASHGPTTDRADQLFATEVNSLACNVPTATDASEIETNSVANSDDQQLARSEQEHRQLELLERGRQQGYLTYDEVNSYLPDEDVSSDKLDELLQALDESGIELVDTKPDDDTKKSDQPVSLFDERAAEAAAGLDPIPAAADLPKLSDDPIRMYLSQMAEISLLSREEEISLAKKIEITRKRFRRSVLGCRYALRATVETLGRVYKGELPFDRTIKVSLTERLTKEQIQSRMPHNLATLEKIMERSQQNFLKLVSKSSSAEDRKAARLQFIRDRRKSLQLVEELSLRTRRVQPLMSQLAQFSRRMTHLQNRIQELKANGVNDLNRGELRQLRRELYGLMSSTHESPRSLATRVATIQKQFEAYEAVKRQLSSGNLRLVVSIAKKISKSGPEFP